MRQLAQMIRLCVESVNDQQGLDISYRDSYGYRGSYGHQCIGISGSHSECMTVIAEVIKELHDTEVLDFESAIDTLMGFDRDSMGRDVIYYWPSIEPIGAEDDEDDVEPNNVGFLDELNKHANT